MIKTVKINNYKSLGNIHVDLAPLTVLIGRSGTGKSNFVEALRFLRDYVAARNDYFLNNRPYHGWPRLLSATASRPVTLSFQITFNAPGIDEDYQYILMLQQTEHALQYPQQVFPAELAEEKLMLGGAVLFHQGAGQWLEPPKLINPPLPNGAMLGAVSGIREITIAFLVLTKGLGCYNFLDTVLLEADSNSKKNDGFADDGSNFLQAFIGIHSNLKEWNHPREMVAALRKLTSSVRTIDLQRPDSQSIIVSHGVGTQLLSFDISQESGGFRRFLAHLIALYQSPPKQTLIFEEPEKGIHPGALAVLVDNFKACPESDRGQIILTTHSPEFLDHFEPEQLRVVDMENYVTKIGPVTAEQIDAIRDNLLRTGELLTVDPARLQTAQA